MGFGLPTPLLLLAIGGLAHFALLLLAICGLARLLSFPLLPAVRLYFALFLASGGY